jgi:xanthine/CO dehydrogenase XdhC/CoxF family maturation factor
LLLSGKRERVVTAHCVVGEAQSEVCDLVSGDCSLLRSGERVREVRASEVPIGTGLEEPRFGDCCGVRATSRRLSQRVATVLEGEWNR